MLTNLKDKEETENNEELDDNTCPVCWVRYKSVLKHLIKMKEYGDKAHAAWFKNAKKQKKII